MPLIPVAKNAGWRFGFTNLCICRQLHLRSARPSSTWGSVSVFGGSNYSPILIRLPSLPPFQFGIFSPIPMWAPSPFSDCKAIAPSQNSWIWKPEDQQVGLKFNTIDISHMQLDYWNWGTVSWWHLLVYQVLMHLLLRLPKVKHEHEFSSWSLQLPDAWRPWHGGMEWY